MPKDRQNTEWLFLYVLEQLVAPFSTQLGMETKCMFRKDKLLVMGASQEECLKLSVAATYALQNRPWVREVDLWKSFVNVDLQFLKDMDQRFLD